MGSDSIPKKTLSDESTSQRSSLWEHAFHRTDSKDAAIYVLDR